MRFDYEPSWEHTYDSFRMRQQTRFRKAAFDRANTFEGSVIEQPTPQLPCCPAEPVYLADFEEAPGG